MKRHCYYTNEKLNLKQQKKNYIHIKSILSLSLLLLVIRIKYITSSHWLPRITRIILQLTFDWWHFTHWTKDGSLPANHFTTKMPTFLLGLFKVIVKCGLWWMVDGFSILCFHYRFQLTFSLTAFRSRLVPFTLLCDNCIEMGKKQKKEKKLIIVFTNAIYWIKL